MLVEVNVIGISFLLLGLFIVEVNDWLYSVMKRFGCFGVMVQNNGRFGGLFFQWKCFFLYYDEKMKERSRLTKADTRMCLIII